MGKPFVFEIILAWWDRFRGGLEPRPCPFLGKGILELRVRALLAGPRSVVDAFGLAAGGRVLEIGPGTGYYSIRAARGRFRCTAARWTMCFLSRCWGRFRIATKRWPRFAGYYAHTAACPS